MAGFAVKYKAQPKAILTDPDKKRPDSCMCLGFAQKQVPDRRRNTNKTTLTLTLSRPTGEGTDRPVSRSFQSGWRRLAAEHDSPSPIRYVFSLPRQGGAGARPLGRFSVPSFLSLRDFPEPPHDQS